MFFSRHACIKVYVISLCFTLEKSCFLESFTDTTDELCEERTSCSNNNELFIAVVGERSAGGSSTCKTRSNKMKQFSFQKLCYTDLRHFQKYKFMMYNVHNQHFYFPLISMMFIAIHIKWSIIKILYCTHVYLQMLKMSSNAMICV